MAVVGHECGNFLERRRQADEIEADAADQGPLVRLVARFQPGVSNPLQYEGIDGVANPVIVAGRGQFGPGRDDVCPVRLVFGAGVNPAAQRFDFIARETLPGVRRRHALGRVGMGHTPNQFARIGVARNDGRPSISLFVRGPVADVQAEIGFPRGGVGTVASEAIVGEDRPDIAIERRLLGCRVGHERNRRCDKHCSASEKAKQMSTSHRLPPRAQARRAGHRNSGAPVADPHAGLPGRPP